MQFTPGSLKFIIKKLSYNTLSFIRCPIIMNAEERNQIINGAIVVAVLLAAGAIILHAAKKLEEKCSETAARKNGIEEKSRK